MPNSLCCEVDPRFQCKRCHKKLCEECAEIYRPLWFDYDLCDELCGDPNETLPRKKGRVKGRNIRRR